MRTSNNPTGTRVYYWVSEYPERVMVAGEKFVSLLTPAGSKMVMVTTVVALNSSATATNRAMPEASVILV